MNMPLLANILGFSALFSYILTLLPTIMRIVFPSTRKTGIPQRLLKQRRLIGILTFFLSLAHAYLLVRKRNFDFFDLKTYWIYVQGISTFIIFTLLTLTSNNWSVKKMKKSWNKLHRLSYFAMFLLIWHIWDKMSGHWTYLTPIEILSLANFIFLFIIRLCIEGKYKQKKLAVLGITIITLIVGLNKLKFVLQPKRLLPTYLYEQTTRSSKTLQEDSTWIYAIAISPDGKILASGGYNGKIQIWNLHTGKLLHTINAHSVAVTFVAISANGNLLASSSWDRQIKLWNLQTYVQIRTLSGHLDDVESVAISSDGKTLASGSWDQTVKLWNVQTGEMIRTFHQTDVVKAVAISWDGYLLASGTLDGKIMIWNLDSGVKTASYGKLKSALLAHDKAVLSIAFSPNGEQLASSSDDGTIKLWNVETGHLLHTFKGHNNAVLSVAFSPNGQQLASGGYDQTIKLWNIQTGELLGIFFGHTKAIWSIAFDPVSHFLASGSADETIKIWSIPPNTGVANSQPLWGSQKPKLTH